MILFKPKPELTAAIAGRTLSGGRVVIPTIRRMRIGRRVRHGRPGYEQMMREDLEYLVIVEFDDVEGLTAYLAHPQHQAIGHHFTRPSAAALAYDYELEDWTAG